MRRRRERAPFCRRRSIDSTRDTVVFPYPFTPCRRRRRSPTIALRRRLSASRSAKGTGCGGGGGEGLHTNLGEGKTRCIYDFLSVVRRLLVGDSAVATNFRRTRFVRTIPRRAKMQKRKNPNQSEKYVFVRCPIRVVLSSRSYVINLFIVYRRDSWYEETIVHVCMCALYSPNVLLSNVLSRHICTTYSCFEKKKKLVTNNIVEITRCFQIRLMFDSCTRYTIYIYI